MLLHQRFTRYRRNPFKSLNYQVGLSADSQRAYEPFSGLFCISHLASGHFRARGHRPCAGCLIVILCRVCLQERPSGVRAVQRRKVHTSSTCPVQWNWSTGSTGPIR